MIIDDEETNQTNQTDQDINENIEFEQDFFEDMLDNEKEEIINRILEKQSIIKKQEEKIEKLKKQKEK